MTNQYTEIQVGEPSGEPIEITLDDLPGEPDAPLDETTVETPSAEQAKPSQTERHKGRAQKRIKELLDEKRQEANARATVEAENQALRAQLAKESKGSREVVKSTLEDQVASLKRELKAAITEGEADAVVNLQEQLTNVLMQLAGTNAEISSYKEVEAQPVQQQRQQAPVTPDKALDWIEDHPQFKTDPLFYQVAIAVNNILINEGFKPDSDDFYEELNDRLAPRFPEVFGTTQESSVSYSKPTTKTVELSSDEETEKPSRTKPKAEQTMSGSSRASSTTVSKPKSSNTVTLTPEHVAQAEKWGISLEQMARRVKNLDQNRDNNGYAPIIIGEKR